MRRKNIFHECKNKIIGLGGIKYLLQGGIKRAGGGNHFAPNVEIEFTRIPHSMLSARRFFTILRVLTNEGLIADSFYSMVHDWIGSGIWDPGIPESQIRGTPTHFATNLPTYHLQYHLPRLQFKFRHYRLQAAIGTDSCATRRCYFEPIIMHDYNQYLAL